MNKICTVENVGMGHRDLTKEERDEIEHYPYWSGGWLVIERPFDKLKRPRIKCPLCGRKMTASYIVDHDGTYITWVLPPHKVKGWWKRGKKKKKNKKVFGRQI